MMEEAAAGVAEVLGERDAQHALATIKYQPPTGAAIELVGWSLKATSTRSEQSFETGVVKNTELCAIFGPREQLEVKGVKQFQLRAIVTVEGQEWNIDAETSSWSGVFVTLGLKREPLSGFHEGRHAQV